MHKTRFLRACVRLGILCLNTDRAVAPAQQAPVTGQVEVVRHRSAKTLPAGSAQDHSNVAVWLTPLDDPNGTYATVSASSRTLAGHQSLQLVQRNKNFDPHVLMIQTGSTVQFPNKDPFFPQRFLALRRQAIRSGSV